MNDSPNPDTSVSPSPFSSFKDKFVFPTSRDFWPSFSFPTPPSSPVKFCIDSQVVTKEVRWHAASGPWGQMKEISDDELEDLDFPFEFPREACEPRAESPAILNDIMWSGDRIKRPDSTTDFEERFTLSSTPTCLEHPISHTFVEPEELFSFSLLEQAHEHPDDHFQQRLERVGAITDSLGKEHSSESDEEIDVVGLADKTQEGKSTGSDGSTYTRKNANRPPRKLRSKRSNGEISEQESEGESARASHNDLERKRRNDLRNRFQCLRKSIPSLEESERAAKITILRRASELIPALQEEEETLIAIKESEKKKNAELLSTLMRLAKNKRV